MRSIVVRKSSSLDDGQVEFAFIFFSFSIIPTSLSFTSLAFSPFKDRVPEAVYQRMTNSLDSHDFIPPPGEVLVTVEIGWLFTKSLRPSKVPGHLICLLSDIAKQSPGQADSLFELAIELRSTLVVFGRLSLELNLNGLPFSHSNNQTVVVGMLKTEVMSK